MKSIQIRIFTGCEQSIAQSKMQGKASSIRAPIREAINQFTVDAQVFPVHMPAGRECVAGHNVD
jgi:hypothetical protein